jgi:hypothetical protein
MTADSQSPTAPSPEAPTSPLRWPQVIAASKASLFCAAALLCLDVVLHGSYLFSILICPIWFLACIVRNSIWQPGRAIALFRVAVPALTLGIVLANTAIQWTIAEGNAAHIIKACDDFHAANGRYPKTLNELVPRFLNSIPRAKYSLMDGEFTYYCDKESGHCILWWCKIPFGKEVYGFESKRWRYID